MASAESATARRKKRPSDTQLALSDEEETAPQSSRQSNGTRANGSKRQKLVPASSDVDDDDAPEEDDDDEEDEDSRSDGVGMSRKGKERAHMNGNGHVGEDEDGDEDEEAAPPPIVTQNQLYERHADGYVTGSITRIKLTDFMTYDFVEFNPGPHLNMILGPNGTGKSTIAAGIAIGLGFKPEVMGRATDIQSYVKQGKEEAWTELDVRGKKGKRNYTIWRRFGKDGRSEWRLNGNSAKRREVLELVASFGIQANNLCCFLAQDRVSEFAKMAPPLTLRETMRAAGDPHLTDWHEKLIEKGQEKKVLDEKVGENVVRRDQVQAQVDTLAPDVEHFENRQNQELQRDILTIWVEYCRVHEMQRAHHESTLALRAIVDQIKDVNRKNRPLKDLLEHHTTLETKASNKVQVAEDELKTANQGVRQERRKIVDTVDKFEAIDSEIAQAKKRIARRAKNIADLEVKRDNAEAQLKVPREQLVEKCRMRQHHKRDGEKEKREVDHKLRDFRAARLDKEKEVEHIGREIDDKMETLRRLGSIEKLRTEAAIESNGSIGAALDWLKEHAAELEHPVIIPAFISLNVPDQRYAPQIEQALSYANLSTFICQSQHDYDKMLQLNSTRYEGRTLSNGKRTQGGVVQLHLVTVRATEANVDPRRPCSEDRMRQLGLDGCANDFVEADPVMIAWLNEKCSFNRTAITSRSMAHISVNDVAQQGFNSIISHDESLRILKSSYGKKANQLSSQTLKGPRFLNRVVDQAAVTKLKDEISDLKRRKVEYEKPITDLNDQIRDAESEDDKAKAWLNDLNREFHEAQTALKDWDKSKAQIDLFKKELDKIHSEPSMAEQRDKLEKQKLAAALKCIPHISTLATHQEESNTHIADSISASLATLQATTNKSVTDKKHQSRNREVIELGRKKERAAEKKAALHAQYMARSAAIRQRVAEEASPAVRLELRTRMQDEQTQTVEDAQAELAQVEANLEISQGVNPQVIVRYKRLCKELEDVSKELSDQETDLNKVKKSIDTILAKFEPALDTLVSTVSARFAAAFDRNGCAGDVRLAKPEDGYEHWGLVPHVSFRDGEAMQPLTGQRQSGGERSYSTIMYLMALSAMARVPFSLVDEINQGMDQQAERTVFNQLVETTCAESAGQYFLITPKLLTGLTYHPKMKVLIVNNGCWLPEGTDKKQKFGDLRGCLQRYKRSIAAH